MSSEPAPRLGSRDLFPHLRARAYLAHAAISPPSLLVQQAMAHAVQDYAEHGVVAFPRWLEQREALRARLAELIGARPADVALTPGTTHSITQLAFGLPWQRGDRVVLFRGEFPANVTPWQRAAEHFGLELCWLPAPLEAADLDLGSPGSGTGSPRRLRFDPVDRILGPLEAALRTGARLVAVSAVQFQTGLAMPLPALGQLCQRYGAELAVDAIQACGVVPLDVAHSGIDYLACGAHKWLMGVEGAGFSYVRPERMARLVPRLAGWLSHTEGESFLFRGPGLLRYDRPLKRSASVFEGSSSNVAGYAALEAAVAPLLSLGVARIFAHVQSYLDALEPVLEDFGFQSLRAADPAHRSGILSVVPPQGVDGATLVGRLRAAGVVVSFPDGLIRFAPHFPNAPGEIAVVRDALAAALST
jgi:selenocysteine lyase/cysteine desulfurase